jgi:hypothetical protein
VEPILQTIQSLILALHNDTVHVFGSWSNYTAPLAGKNHPLIGEVFKVLTEIREEFAVSSWDILGCTLKGDDSRPSAVEKLVTFVLTHLVSKFQAHPIHNAF